jgi:NTE family protein
MARSILNLQVGLAFGGGAAWGWAHIGMLEQLERSGLPIDVIAGCSMGSIIGGLYCSGISVPQMIEIALYWRTRMRPFIEWRFWRMSLISNKVARKAFALYFADRCLHHGDSLLGQRNGYQNGPRVHHFGRSIIDCIRASIALPDCCLLERGDHLLVDAGIHRSGAAESGAAHGRRYVVAVNAMAARGTAVSVVFP